MKKKLLIQSLISLDFVTISCNSTMPSWIKESNHALSPDGKAAIYESIINGNNVSVGTWVIADIGSGGTGVFDI